MGNRYTIIYTESWTAGSHQNTIVRMVRATQNDLESFSDMLIRHGIDETSISFMFNGWPFLRGETNDLS